MQHGKITTESLNIISTRPATKNERLFFDPIKTGKRYAILMMIAFSYIPFLIVDASAIVWGAYYLSILLLGLSKYRGNMSALLNIKDDYVKARVEALLSIWDRSIPSERISNVKVRFLGSNNEEIYWNNILDAVSSTSKHYSVNEYIEMITNTAERLKKNYIHGIDYAVIQDIEEKNGIQTLIIDMRMNERSYFIYIAQLGIIFIALIMMLFAVIKYKKRNRNVMHDQL